MRYFIEIAYHGKQYFGWQRQPNAISVQETIENALQLLLKEDISITGAGRTDTGVHAKQMFAHFDSLIDFELNQITYKLNRFLPKDISIENIGEVSSEAHARFDAISRSYTYKIATKKDVFENDFVHNFTIPLDLDMMNEAGKILLTYSDFQCFSKSNTDVKTYICDIKKAVWRKENHLLIFEITADRFLRNMVRAIVGTMINVGLGKTSIDDLHQLIKSKNRSEAGYSVPAKGLSLVKIDYPENIFI